MPDREQHPEHSSSGPEVEHDFSGFHERLEIILSREPSSAAFARKAGLSQSGFHRIEKGGRPKLEALIAIANAAEVKVDWLLYGDRANSKAPSEEGQSRPTEIDKWLFSRAVEGVRRVYERAGVRLPTVNEIELAADIYNRVSRLAEDQDARRGALLMALDQLERDLQNDPDKPQSSKRRA